MSQVRLVVHDRGHDLAGIVHEGESWAAAARRTVASLHRVPEPVDLSAEVKAFVVDHEHRVTLRAMEQADLALVARWRPASGSDVDHYGPSIDGRTDHRLWLAEVDGRPAGFLADTGAAEDPRVVDVDHAVDPEWGERGLGPRVLWAWMERARHRFPAAEVFRASADAGDERSALTLGQAGFAVASGPDPVLRWTLDVRRVLG